MKTSRLSLALLFLQLMGCGDDSIASQDASFPDASFPDAATMDAPLLEDGGPDAEIDLQMVVTAQGPMLGRIDEGASAFLGIPYAEAPVGDLRWRSPEADAPWEGVLDASEYGSECVQPTGILQGEPGSSYGDEDCLFLNVWAPSDRTADERLPVMVFIHGGGNIAGSAADPVGLLLTTDGGPHLYEGSRLSARGRVVVVTLNYRLGALGFMTHPELADESDAGASGNYGLQDQILALQWVQENIEQFGGDRERVMLFGQSGGGRDTLLLVTSPKTTGLFSLAAIHSAPLGAQRAAENAQQRELLVEELGCDGDAQIECMRGLDAGALVEARASQPLGLASAAFRPSVDGDVVPDQPMAIIARGEHQPIPLMLGTNENEYSLRWEDVTAANFEARVVQMVGPRLAPLVTEEYPTEDYANAREAFYTMMSDRNVTCPARAFVRIASNVGTEIYFYRFRQVLHTDLRRGVDAFHTSELLYLFQHMNGEAFEVDEEDRQTEGVMLDYWTRFAAAGTPNGEGLANWPAFEGTNEAYMTLQAVPAAAERIKEEKCNFWESTR